MKKDLILPKEVSKWMESHHLKLIDSFTEAGMIASPDFNLDSFKIKNRAEFLSSLNNLYGLRLEDSFLSVKGKGCYRRSLEDIEKCRSDVEKLKLILPEEFGLTNDLVYIGGISIPDRNILYIEYPFLDRDLQESYTRQDYRPNVFQGVEFISLSKENFT
jgi:hypothetical protein